MTPESYTEIATNLGLILCSTDEPSHKTGFTAQFRIVHWQERRVTRSGVKRFLLLVAPMVDEISPRWPQWYQFWLRIKTARKLSRDIHVTLQPSLWRPEKARLLAMLTREDIVPYREALAPARERALRWARR